MFHFFNAKVFKILSIGAALLTGFVCFSFPARAEPNMTDADLKVSPPFADHMVLQRDAPVPVWGTAAPGAKVSVSFGGQTRTGAADASGHWLLRLAPLVASATPRELLVSCASKRLALRDVLVGDVWLCAGQSNMQAWVAGSDVEALVASADVASIRVFLVDVTATAQPQSLFRQGPAPVMVPVQHEKMAQYGLQWTASSRQDAPWFSAVTYAFGRALHDKTHVPVGLMTAALGGTRAQAWMPRAALQSAPSGANLLSQPDAQWSDNSRPSGLYNGSIAPLVPFAIKGVVWYQGESDADDFDQARQYRDFLPALINGWRREWKSDFPFLVVQLPAFGKPQLAPADAPWAWLREAQLATAATAPNTALAVTVDTGSTENLHPPTKKVIGDRLARAALALDNRSSNATGPLLTSSETRNGQIFLRFAGVGERLVTQEVVRGDDRVPAQPLLGFAVCGPDGKFMAADARIIATDGVVVSSSQVAHPVFVRYGWAAFPRCNLWSSDGLPASPFRTDHFLPQRQTAK